MNKYWKNEELENYIEVNPKESLKKGVVAKKVAMDKLKPFFKEIPEYEMEKFTGGTKFKNGDTIMARITPCLENGKVAFVDILDEEEVGFGSTEYIVFRAKKGLTDPQFVYYLVRSSLVREPSIKSMVGSSGRQRVQTDVVKKIKINFPELIEQMAIANILKVLDDKISLNNKINKNLLQQMESIYKAWFTDFVPFDGNRPTDWVKSNIYSIADIIYGAPFSSKLFNTDGEGIPIIRIRDLKEQAFVTYTTEKHPKGYLIHPGDIIVGMDGEFRPYIWGNTEAWLNQRVCIFDNKRPKGKAFVLFTIKPLLYQIEQTQVATTVIHIGKKDYDAFEFYLPDSNTLNQFDEMTSPMIDQIVVNSLENKRLAELRDSLIPRLMSGELDVSEVNL